MLWCFSVGLGITLFGLLAGSFPLSRSRSRSLSAAARALGARVHRLLADCARRIVRRDRRLDRQMGGLALALRRTDSIKLLHAPLYDSAMFVSYLVVIPPMRRSSPISR